MKQKNLKNAEPSLAWHEDFQDAKFFPRPAVLPSLSKKVKHHKPKRLGSAQSSKT